VIVQSSSRKGVQGREGVAVDRVGASAKASMAKTARFWCMTALQQEATVTEGYVGATIRLRFGAQIRIRGHNKTFIFFNLHPFYSSLAKQIVPFASFE
jgi:hypothetical protein